MAIPSKAIVESQQPDVRSSTGTNKWTWEEFGVELAGNQNELNSFQSLIDHPLLDFNLDYSQGWSMPIPHLGKLRRAAQWLSAATLYDLHHGNPPGACTNVQIILAIIKGETDERTTVSQLVRVALASISVPGTRGKSCNTRMFQTTPWHGCSKIGTRSDFLLHQNAPYCGNESLL